MEYDNNIIIAYGKTLKPDGDIYRGVLIPYGSPDDRDLHQQWFSPQTDYNPTQYPIRNLPAMYNHGYDDYFGAVKIGIFKDAWEDDAGVWVDLQLSDYEEYLALLESINDKQGKKWKPHQLRARAKSTIDRLQKILSVQGVGLSSGAHPTSVTVADDGMILSWYPIEGSVTLTPAMPQATRLEPVKSFAARLKSANGRYRADDETVRLFTLSSKGHKAMNPEDIRKLIEDRLAELRRILLEELGAMEDEGESEAVYDEAAMMDKMREMVTAMLDERMDTPEKIGKAITDATPAIIAAALKAVTAKDEAEAAVRESARKAIEAVRKAKPAKSKLDVATPVKNLGTTGEAGNFIKALAARKGLIPDAPRDIKDYNPTVGNQGGYLMGTLLFDELIEPLRSELVLEQAGVTTTRVDNAGVVQRARMLTAPSSFFPGISGQQIANADATFGLVSGNMVAIGGTAVIPRSSLYGSPIEIQKSITEQALKSLMIDIERTGLLGVGAVTGTNTGAEPLGIANVAPGVNLAANGRVPTYEDLITAETEIATANANPSSESFAYIMSPREFGTFESLTDTAGRPLLTWTYADTVPSRIRGRKTLRTTYVPINQTVGTSTDCGTIVAGEFRYAEKVLFSGIETIVDEVSQARNMQIVITVYTYFTWLIHQPSAFYVLNGARPLV